MELITNLRGRMCMMHEGDQIEVSVGDFSPSTVHNYASELGFRYGRKYTCTNNRTARTITVTRLS